MSMALLCNRTITLYRPTVTYDALGGEVRTMNVIFADVGARVLQVPRGTTKDINMRLSVEISHQIIVYQNIGAHVDDMIQIDDGRQMLVVAQSDEGGCERVWSIDCLEINPES